MPPSYPRVPRKEALPGNIIRASRHLLRWSREQLAEKAGLTPATITHIESGRTPSRASHNAIQRVLTGAGITFTFINDESVVIHFHRKRRTPQI